METTATAIVNGKRVFCHDFEGELLRREGSFKCLLKKNKALLLTRDCDRRLIESENSLIEKQLCDIKTALDRMRRGVFGVCQDCGADISEARLVAFLTAKHCFACQKSKRKK
jgi:hypothetical protein